MPAPELNRVKEVFAQALPLRGDFRKTFLDQACSDDADLRAEVEAYLSAEKPGRRFAMPSVYLPVALFEDLLHQIEILVLRMFSHSFRRAISLQLFWQAQNDPNCSWRTALFSCSCAGVAMRA